VLGVFVGWRGLSFYAGWLTNLTFWNRKTAAADELLVKAVAASVRNTRSSSTAVWRPTPVSSVGRVGTTNRSTCARNNFLTADSPATPFFRRTGYEMIDKGTH
jgi:hypothetical protein